MIDTPTQAFKSPILAEFARIIIRTFTKARVTGFLEEAGSKNTTLPSWRINQELQSILVELQNTSGPSAILRLIEIVCDPQEHMGKLKRHKKIVHKFNECLQFYSLKINEQSKIVLIHEEQKTSSTNSDLFRSRHFHDEVVKHAKRQFTDQHYFDAVDECCKAFGKHVEKKSKLGDHGFNLMSKALGNAGSLKLNQQKTETEKNLQQGLMYMCMGLMLGIRNPIEHEPQFDYSINRQDALEILSFISYLYKQIDQCVYTAIPSEQSP